MTEKEKAALGMLYNANYDTDLKEERLDFQELCAEYNRLMPKELEKRTELMKRILGKTEGEFMVEQPFFCDYGYNIEVGERCFLNYHCTILDGAKVTFGHDVFVAPNCSFYTAGHPFDIEQRNEGLEYAYPIHIGNNVWIGGNVTVLPGVTIGDGTVVAAGSVVTKDLPAGVLAAGNPCRIIRNLSE